MRYRGELMRPKVSLFLVWLTSAALIFAGAALSQTKNPGEKAADPKNTGPTKVTGKPHTTTSGLQYWDIVQGTGSHAVAGMQVSVNYTGWLQNGKQFDSSIGRGPFSFTLGAGRVIKGWDEGVVGMRVGGKRQLRIPPELAYGSRGAPGAIPPYATLTFDVELLGVR
jgi:FKBP-type peptidyl-prolyl cis-trans isomerase